MPRRMQIEFSAIVQELAAASETELDSEQIWSVFEKTYLMQSGGQAAYHSHKLFDSPDGQGIDLQVYLPDGTLQSRQGTGNGPIAATVAALDLPLRIDSYEERSLNTGADAAAMAIVEVVSPGVPGSRFGVGKHPNIVTASVLAVISAAARFTQTS